MKKRRNRSSLKARRQSDAVTRERIERLKAGELGPPDPMPDGSKRVARQDAMSFLVGNGRLTPAQEQAAREIEMVFRSRCSAVFTKVQNLERVDGGSFAVDDGRDIDANRRYDAFAEWSAKNRRPATEKRAERNYHSLLLDVIIDSLTLQQLERMHRMGTNTGEVWIKRGLSQYALLAGWIREAA